MNRVDDKLLVERLLDLPHTADPSPELEDRVVAGLRSRGLVASSPVSSQPADRRRLWQYAIAASLVAALGGWFAHGFWNQGLSQPSPTQTQFLLLLSEPEGLNIEPPTADLVAEYRQWAQGLAADGRLVDAGRLSDEGTQLEGLLEIRELTKRDIQAATGYFVIRAVDLVEATALAQTCPHLRYGGVIAVRPVASGNQGPGTR